MSTWTHEKHLELGVLFDPACNQCREFRALERERKHYAKKYARERAWRKGKRGGPDGPVGKRRAKSVEVWE
jgi:hypothetical protein